MRGTPRSKKCVCTSENTARRFRSRAWRTGNVARSFTFARAASLPNFFLAVHLEPGTLIAYPAREDTCGGSFGLPPETLAVSSPPLRKVGRNGNRLDVHHVEEKCPDLLAVLLMPCNPSH